MDTEIKDSEFDEPIKKFGERLKELRVSLGYTQPELASKLGCKRQTIGSWEQGQTTPDIKALLQLQSIARAHERVVGLGELLGEIKIDSGETPLKFALRLLQQIDSAGIRGVYPNRGQALSAFIPFLEKEQKSICIVASSFLGVRVTEERIISLLRRKVASVQDFKVLMTHPEICRWRETQEGRRPGIIYEEIRESFTTLLNWGVKQENIKFHRGAPTIFLIFTPDRMLANPYTYMTEAYKTVTLEVAPTGAEDDVYSQYFNHHFKRPWESNSVVAGEELKIWENNNGLKTLRSLNRQAPNKKRSQTKTIPT